MIQRYPGKEWIPCRDMVILWSIIRSLREVPVWRLLGCWGVPAYSLLPVFLQESISFHADAAVVTCQSLFLWLALVPPVAVWEASVASHHAVGNCGTVFRWSHGLR